MVNSVPIKSLVSLALVIILLVVSISCDEGSSEGLVSAELPLDVREYEGGDGNSQMIPTGAEHVSDTEEDDDEDEIGLQPNSADKKVQAEDEKHKVPLREILMRMKVREC